VLPLLGSCCWQSDLRCCTADGVPGRLREASQCGKGWYRLQQHRC
jgi:hypothetical protein